MRHSLYASLAVTRNPMHPQYSPYDLVAFNYLWLPKHAFGYAITPPRKVGLQLEKTCLSFKIQIKFNLMSFRKISLESLIFPLPHHQN